MLAGTAAKYKNAHSAQSSEPAGQSDATLPQSRCSPMVSRVTSRGMATVFTKIINGELPGRFVYRDAEVAAFLTIEPVAYGHVLVVPVQEIDRWTDMPAELWGKLNEVAQVIGKAICEAFDAPRCGYMIAGFEVPHTHIHLFPASDMSGYSLQNIIPMDQTDPAKMDDAAAKIRAGLRSQGVAGVPEDEA